MSLIQGSFWSHEKLPNLEKPIGCEEKETEVERPGTKRKKGTDETEEEEESPSSVSSSSSSQKRPAMKPTFGESMAK